MHGRQMLGLIITSLIPVNESSAVQSAILRPCKLYAVSLLPHTYGAEAAFAQTFYLTHWVTQQQNAISPLTMRATTLKGAKVKA